MRIRRPRFSIRTTMIVVAVLSVGIAGVVRSNPNWQYYAQGWWEAECELWSGTASKYGYGGLRIGDIDNYDPEMGLPIRAIAGCVIQEGEEQRIQGHDDRIWLAIRSVGPPRNSLKAWNDQIAHLKDWFELTAAKTPPALLVLDQPATPSPDGEYSIRLVRLPSTSGGSFEREVQLYRQNQKIDSLWINGLHRNAPAIQIDLLWGPTGSNLMLIRSREASTKTVNYQVYDRRTPLFLREETWIDGKPQDEVLFGGITGTPVENEDTSDPE